MNTVAKLALSLGAIGFALAGATAQAQTNVISDPVGFYKITITNGANFISAPLHKIQAFRGSVASVVGNSINFTGSPSFTNNAFAPADGFNQYIAIITQTSNSEVYTNNLTVPPTVVTNTFVGDWWPIVSNSATNVTVNPGPDTLASKLSAGNQVEIRKLTSLADVFGTGPSVILNKDSDGLPSTATEDVIRYVNGTSFGPQIFYYDGSLGGGEGYIVGESGPFDGTTITLEPDEPVMLFRRAGSAVTNVTILGQVQTRPLTHYLAPGANTFANVFPANATLIASGLRQAKGFVPDADGLPSTATEDVIRQIVATSFGPQITLYAGESSGPTPPTWLVGGDVGDAFPLRPGEGFIYFVAPSTGGRVWRQPVPFNP